MTLAAKRRHTKVDYLEVIKAMAYWQARYEVISTHGLEDLSAMSELDRIAAEAGALLSHREGLRKYEAPCRVDVFSDITYQEFDAVYDTGFRKGVHDALWCR